MTVRPISWKAALIAAIAALGGAASAQPSLASPDSSAPVARAAAAPLTEAQAEAIGTDAFVYGIPLMEFVRQAATQTSVTVPNALSDAPLNQLGNARQLANAKQQVFVQPNLDTLYSMGHLNLSHEALVFHVPALPNHRYYSFEFLDPYTNVVHYVGTRTTGDGAGTYLITGPSFHGKLPAGMHRITSAYQNMWAVGRTLVYGNADLPEVHRIQNGYKLLPLSEYLKHGLSWTPPRPQHVVSTHTTHTVPTGLQYFDQLGTALAENPPPGRDKTILAELRTAGIGPGLHPSTEPLSPAVVAGLTAAADGGLAHINALRTEIALHSFKVNDGWFVPPSDTGSYGTDYSFRSIVAVYGIAANRPKEALYIVGGADQNDAILNGANHYVIHFPPHQLPPANYFWSVTMYDSSFYLVPNSINRYSIGNRTAGVRYKSDGSLDLYIQSTPPAGHLSNWLPSPASGQFEMSMRLYGPKPSVLDGHYHYPPITQVS